MQFVDFLGTQCRVVHDVNADGNTEMRLIAAETEQLFAMASVNTPDLGLTSDQVVIKSYAENTGLLEALLDAGVVKRTGQVVRVGFATCEICLVCPETEEKPWAHAVATVAAE